MGGVWILLSRGFSRLGLWVLVLSCFRVASASETGIVGLSSFFVEGDYVVGSNASRQFGSAGAQVNPFQITLAGIPAGATIYSAWINWSYLTNFPGEASEKTIKVDGNNVVADFVDTGDLDLGWGFQKAVAYTANITSLVTGNGAYSIEGAVDDPDTGGIAEGATILAVWRKPGSQLRAINIYNGYTSTMTSDSNPTLDMIAPYTGGDAQFFVNALDGQSQFSDEFFINGILSSQFVGGQADNAWTGRTGNAATNTMYDVYKGDISGVRIANGATTLSFQTRGFSNGYAPPGSAFTDCIGHSFAALSYAAVPEPSTYVLFAVGFLTLGVLKKRRSILQKKRVRIPPSILLVIVGGVMGCSASAFPVWPESVTKALRKAIVLHRLNDVPAQRPEVKPWKLDLSEILAQTDENGNKPEFPDAYLHFYQQRAFPNAEFDWEQYDLAAELRDLMEPARIPNGLEPVGPTDTAPIGNWSYLGPRDLDTPFQQWFGLRAISGRINDIAYPPNPRKTLARANIAYAASPGGGVWKTTDGGANWSQLSDTSNRWSSLQVASIAVTNTDVSNPTNANDIVFAGSGDVRGIYRMYSIGLLRSTDGGATWEAPRNFNNQPITSIVVDPDDPKLVTLCTGGAAIAINSNGNFYPPASRQDYKGEIWQSADAGATWAKVLATKAYWSKIAIGAKDADGDRWYYAVGIQAAAGPAILVRSLQRGANGSWNALNGPGGLVAGVPASASMQVATSKVNSETVYVMSGQNRNVWISEAGGSNGTWSSLLTGVGGGSVPNQYLSAPFDNWGQSSYDVFLETTYIPGGYRDVLLVGLISFAAAMRDDTNGQWVWADIGKTGAATTVTHNDQQCIAVNPRNPGSILLGNDGGVYGVQFNWQGIANPPTTAALEAAFAITTTQSRTLGVTQFYTGAWHPTNPDVMLGGTQDNATPRSIGRSWNGGPNGTLQRWNNCATGGDGNGCAIFMGNGNTQYATSNFGGFFDVTLDGWQSELAIRPPVGVAFTGANYMNFVPAVALDVLDNYYVGHWDLYRRNPGAVPGFPGGRFAAGMAGMNLTGGGANAFVTAIHIALADPDRIYTGSSDGGLWMTRDGGANWSRIDRTAGGGILPNGTPPQLWVTSIAADPFNPNRIFVGYSGVAAPGQPTVIDHIYRCIDTTETDANRGFQNIDGGGNPLPPVPVNDIAVISTPENLRTDQLGLFPNVEIPDNNPAGVTSTMAVGSTITSITRVRVRLKIDGTWNGDLQVKLAKGGKTSYLMNRVGRTAASTFGYPDDGVDIWLDDVPNAPNGDIHVYQAVTGGNLPNGVPLSGTWQPDARTAAANVVVDTSPRTAFFAEFNGQAASGDWTLTVSDNAGGDTHTLRQWEIEITGTTAAGGDVPNTVIVASDSGAFYTENASATPATWTNATQPLGLPNVQCNAIKYIPGTGFINVATFGRGMWRIPIGISNVAGFAGSPYRNRWRRGIVGRITFRAVLGRPAPPGGATVNLATNNAGVLPIPNPQTLVVPAGSITATRALTFNDPGAAGATVTLSASYGGENRKTKVIITR